MKFKHSLFEGGSVWKGLCGGEKNSADNKNGHFWSSLPHAATKPSVTASRKTSVLFLVARRWNVTLQEPFFKAHTYSLDFLSDPNCKLEDKTEDGEAIDCKKRPEDGEELEDEAVHSCDSCLQVFESLSDITEHKIHQCHLAGKQHWSLPCSSHCSCSDFFLPLCSFV